MCLAVILATLPINLIAWCIPGGLRGWLFRTPDPGERNEERSASMELVAGMSIAGEPIGDFCRRRCGVLVSTPSGEGLVKVARRGDAMHVEVATFEGTCAQVTTDGYLLTAAHCLKTGHDLHVYRHDADGGVRKARLVKAWAEPIDLALVKIDPAGDKAFSCGEAGASTVGSVVVSAGLKRHAITVQFDMAAPDAAHLAVTESPFDLAAGRVVNREPVPGQGGFSELVTSLPLVPGNSGGPVIDIHGRLVAINTRMDKAPRALFRGVAGSEPNAYAIALDTAAIEAAIRADRKSQAAMSGDWPAPNLELATPVRQP